MNSIESDADVLARTRSVPFTPALNANVWNEIQAFVEALVLDVSDAAPYPRIVLMSTVSRYVAWCVQAAGMEMDRRSLFARRMIAYGINHAFPDLTAASRGNMRSQLLRVGEVILGADLDLPRLPALAASDPSAPYSPANLRHFRIWANGQNTVHSTRSARALLALGAGCGLSTREISAVHAGDVRVDQWGIRVTVREDRPRQVPALHNWEEMIQQAVTGADPDKPLFRHGHDAFYPNIVTNFVARSAGVGLKPQTQRLRATWLVAHLDAGTPTVLLLPAAGLTSLESLSRYTRFLAPIQEPAARAALSMRDD